MTDAQKKALADGRAKAKAAREGKAAKSPGKKPKNTAQKSANRARMIQGGRGKPKTKAPQDATPSAAKAVVSEKKLAEEIKKVVDDSAVTAKEKQKLREKLKVVGNDLKGVVSENAQLLDIVEKQKRELKKKGNQKMSAPKAAATAKPRTAAQLKADRKRSRDAKARKKADGITTAPKASSTVAKGSGKGGKRGKRNIVKFKGHTYRKAEQTTAAIWEELKRTGRGKTAKLTPTGRKIKTIVRTKPRYSNPMVTAGEIAASVGTLGVSLVLASWVDRFVATRSPGGTAKSFHGVGAMDRIMHKPGMMRYGVLLGTTVVAGGGAYLTRKMKYAPMILGAIAVGFGAFALLKAADNEIMPRVLSDKDDGLGMRLYPVEQVKVQEAAGKKIADEDKALSGKTSGLRGLFTAKVGRPPAPPASTTRGCGCSGACGPNCKCADCKAKYATTAGYGVTAGAPDRVGRPPMARPVVQAPSLSGGPALAAPSIVIERAVPAQVAAETTGTLAGPPASVPSAPVSEPPVAEYTRRVIENGNLEVES